MSVAPNERRRRHRSAPRFLSPLRQPDYPVGCGALNNQSRSTRTILPRGWLLRQARLPKRLGLRRGIASPGPANRSASTTATARIRVVVSSREGRCEQSRTRAVCFQGTIPQASALCQGLHVFGSAGRAQVLLLGQGGLCLHCGSWMALSAAVVPGVWSRVNRRAEAICSRSTRVPGRGSANSPGAELPPFEGRRLELASAGLPEVAMVARDQRQGFGILAPYTGGFVKTGVVMHPHCNA
jgi:hypothetical protein